ncbi:hypothetical protein [Labrys neptuniae]
MAHVISGIVAQLSWLRDKAPPLIEYGAIAPLNQSFGMLLLWADSIRHLSDEMEDLDQATVLLSQHGKVGNVATEYIGGSGFQRAGLWDAGECIVKPEWDYVPYGPINNVLANLGVSKDGHRDEFDALGLGKFRYNEDWMIFALYGELSAEEADAYSFLDKRACLEELEVRLEQVRPIEVQ